jgi:hypothetical protein
MARAAERTGLDGLPQAAFEVTGRDGKKSLTVFRSNLGPSLKISAWGSMVPCLHLGIAAFWG